MYSKQNQRTKGLLIYTLTVLFVILVGPFALAELNPSKPIWLLVMRILFAVPWFLISIRYNDGFIRSAVTPFLLMLILDTHTGFNISIPTLIAIYLFSAMKEAKHCWSS